MQELFRTITRSANLSRGNDLPVQSIKAARLLAENVSALLARDRLDQHDLAVWCRHSDPWVSDFLRGKRNWTLADLDRVADFFHLVPYQLFQPGVSNRTERRAGVDRRSAKERRIGRAQQFMMETAKEIDGKHPRRRSPDVVASSPLHEALARIAEDTTKRIAAAIRQFEIAGERAAKPRKALPDALPGGGTDRPADAGGTKNT